MVISGFWPLTATATQQQQHQATEKDEKKTREEQKTKRTRCGVAGFLEFGDSVIELQLLCLRRLCLQFVEDVTTQLAQLRQLVLLRRITQQCGAASMFEHENDTGEAQRRF